MSAARLPLALPDAPLPAHPLPQLCHRAEELLSLGAAPTGGLPVPILAWEQGLQPGAVRDRREKRDLTKETEAFVIWASENQTCCAPREIRESQNGKGWKGP